MRRLLQQLVLLTLVVFLLSPSMSGVQAVEAVVRAVLFYSPSCGHCHQVINELLLPMLEQYGNQLQISGIDTAQDAGAQLYHAAHEVYQVPPERRGVPTLVVGDTVLVGSREIPMRFPGLVEEGLAAGGIDWPDIPGLPRVLAGSQPSGTSPSAAKTGTGAQSAAQPADTATDSSAAIPLDQRHGRLC